MASKDDSGGVPGLPILGLFFGAALVFSGLKGGSVIETFRTMIKGDPLPSGESLLPPPGRVGAPGATGEGIIPIGGGGVAATVVGEARKAIGTPYRWGGHAPGGFDCSGLVSYCLTQAGVNIPYKPHTVAARFYTWGDAPVVPRNQCAPGDLVCWVTHIGIATGPNTMINAPDFGLKVREQAIWKNPAPLIRRPRAYGG